MKRRPRDSETATIRDTDINMAGWLVLDLLAEMLMKATAARENRIRCSGYLQKANYIMYLWSDMVTIRTIH